MINGFLNISRFESGKIEIIKSPFNIGELLKEVVKEIEMTGISHVIDLNTCNPVVVNADREKIGSVVSNLLSNAVKYSPRGKRIEVSCDQLDNHVRVSVRDEGMGIKPHDRDKIFDRYYRVTGNDTQHISGFGIGLYLSAEIVRRHDGEIGLESELEQGSTFWFTLPL